MDAAALIAKLQAARESSVEVATGKRLKVRRPLEADMPRFRNGVSVELACECVVGWEGVTEADLLGAAVGASDDVPFDAGVAAETLRDRVDWVEKVSRHVAELITTHIEQRVATAKN